MKKISLQLFDVSEVDQCARISQRAGGSAGGGVALGCG